MPCPFPGMDPYIERPAIWPDFHAGFIFMLRSALQPLLRPRYVAMIEDRICVVEAETIRESVLHIIEPAASNRIVTAIELLSPNTKTPGWGQLTYQEKRNDLWKAGANFVEIDLLRQATPARGWHYSVIVHRYHVNLGDYTILLEYGLPRTVQL